MTNSLLPPNATKLERALEAGGARIVDVQAPADIGDPMTCPIWLLPWLAWGLSVDTWDANWSEQDKREAVAGSIAFHRLKGTRLSVETVLSRFDELAYLVEWHEAQPQRPAHTFEVILPMIDETGAAGGQRASAAFAEAIIREIGRVKPLREHFRLVQQLMISGGVGIQGVARIANYARQMLTANLLIGAEWARYLQAETGEPLQTETADMLDTVP